MAGKSNQSSPRNIHYGRKRTITSCVECHRRKQKCNRVLPCNFCSARGVPEKCRYGVDPNASERVREHASSTAIGSTETDQITESSSTLGLVDQIGYSSVSRRGELQAVEEHEMEHNFATSILPASIQSDTYRSLVDRLPSRDVIEKLINAHFSFENWSFSILEEHRFRNTYMKVCHFRDQVSHRNEPSVELLAFPAVLFATMALALQSTSPTSVQAQALDLVSVPQCLRLSQWYLDTGVQILEVIKQTPTIMSIEFHLLNMAWLKGSGRGNEAWRCLGVALRQAQEIDLHQIDDHNAPQPDADVSNTLTRLWDTEYSKRLWAKIFIMDSHMAVAFGRPRGINREDCSTSAPLDCEYPLNTSQTVPISTIHGQQPPNSFSPVMFSIALSHKYHDLMSMRASKLDRRDYSRITHLHNDVESLMANMPLALQPNFPDTTWDSQMPQLPLVRQRLLTSASIFLLALHRPYITTHLNSRTAAMDAAFTILQAQHELFNIVPEAQHKLYGYSFYTIDASIFLTATILKYPNFDSGANIKALQEVNQACVRLRSMEERSSIARSGRCLLQRCHGLIGDVVPSYSDTIEEFDSMTESQLQPTNIWLEPGFQTLDAATRELLSLLDDSSVSTDLHLSATNNASSGEPLQLDHSTDTTAPSFSTGTPFSNMTGDHVNWQ